MKKQLLTVLAISVFTAGFAQTTLLSESFTGQVQPAGWTNDSLGQPNVWLWTFDNPGARTITGAGFDADFAILDSDFDGNGNSQISGLTTVPVSTMGYNAVRLSFDEQFRAYAGSMCDLDYSIDGGVTWTSIRNTAANVGYPDPAVNSVFTLPANAAGVADLRIKFTYTGTWGWWWAIDNVLVEGLPDCTGTPTAGSITGAPSAACPNVPYTLTLTGATADAGITYQWMSSTNGTNFTVIPGVTGTSYTDSTLSQIYYQVVVICNGSGMSASTSIINIPVNPPIMCYCTATHPGCADPDFISTVELQGTALLNNDSTCTTAANGAYTAYPATGNTTGSIVQGLAYVLNVTTQNDNIISVWIDYDQSGSYEPSEWTQVCLTSVANVPNTATINVPPTATLGLTGMRVRSRLTGFTNDATSACLAMGSGECEDYLITIDPFTGIKENTALQFGMYPNPAKNALTLKLSTEQIGSTIRIVDVLGKLIITKEAKNTEEVLNIEELLNGVYFVSIENEHGSMVKRLVVSK